MSQSPAAAICRFAPALLQRLVKAGSQRAQSGNETKYNTRETREKEGKSEHIVIERNGIYWPHRKLHLRPKNLKE